MTCDRCNCFSLLLGRPVTLTFHSLVVNNYYCSAVGDFIIIAILKYGMKLLYAYIMPTVFYNCTN